MPPLRATRVVTAVASLSLLFFTLQGYGQNPQSSAFIVETSALPPLDRGVMPDISQSPDSPEARTRAAIRAASPRERIGSSGAPYVAGKVIVKFRDGTSVASRVTARSMASARSSEQPSYADFEVLQIDPAADAEEAARELAERPDVEYAQAAYRIRPQFVPNDSLYSRQWNFPAIDLERAWDINSGATSSIIVAVVDTGIAYTNVTMRYRASAFTGETGIRYPALGDLTLSFVAAPELGPESRFVSPRDFIWNTNLPLDLLGHGTHVSGTIGQVTNNGVGTAGVAFNVRLMPVKVADSIWDEAFGAPNSATDDIVARGIRYAADNGANIINLSLGREGPPAPAIEDAIRHAVSRGAFVAIAGGNEFELGNPTPVIAEIASRVPGAVSVAAADRGHNRAYYSSRGPWIELSAPGGAFRTYGTEGGILQQTYDFALVETYTLPLARFVAPRFDTVAYVYYVGTSMATPHVSGLAAMLMQQGVTSPAAIEAAMQRFATDRGRAGRDDEFGHGEINARATLRGLGLAR